VQPGIITWKVGGEGGGQRRESGRGGGAEREKEEKAKEDEEEGGRDERKRKRREGATWNTCPSAGTFLSLMCSIATSCSRQPGISCTRPFT
jgi:hypothetical protein